MSEIIFSMDMRFFFVFFAIVFFTRSYSQPSSIKELGVEQGLSNNYVVSITQDKDGFLWFATEEGLNKFDGTRFIHYYKHNHGISGNELNCIYADPQAPVIWIATQRAGLNAYNYQDESLEVFKHTPQQANSLITNDVTAIAPAADGNLWISTYHRGVEYFNKETKEFRHYNKDTFPELSSDNVWTIMDDGNENLYIGHVAHGMSIVSLKDKQIRNYTHNPDDPESIPGDEVHCLYKDNNDNIWVGTDNGLALFHPETGDFIRPDKSPETPFASAIFDIRQTDDNKLWVSTELNGIFVIDLKQYFFMSPGTLSMEHYTVGYNRYSLSNPTVRCVFQDSFENIWLGTYGGGINFIRHTPPLFHVFSYSPIPEDPYSMNNRTTLSLCFDAEKRLWIGTDGGGINVFDNGKRIKVYSKESNDLSQNTVQALLKDSQDNIWIGTFVKGINHYNHKTKKITPVLLDGKNDSDIRCFYEDSHANIWVGTNTGIYVFDPVSRHQIRHYNKQNARLPENLVRSLVEDRQGRIWVGTFGGGLAVYTPEMELIRSYNEHTGFCSNTINYLFPDSHGRVWVATGEGLVCFTEPDSTGYRAYGREEGLSNVYIRAITEDRDGNIWFSTNAGISCYEEESSRFQSYNHFGRIPLRSFSSAVVKDNNKDVIYFGSINGTYFFEPFTVLRRQEVPPVIITEMKIYEASTAENERKSINYFNDQNKDIELTHKQNTFSIFFNVQDYSLADQVDYAYRLKGIDDGWHTVEDNNVTFRNIPPGRYRFEVSARMKNQTPSNDIYTLSIHIQPPIWLSWWAKAFYFIIAASIVFAILYAYKKRIDIQSSYELEKKNHEHEQELNSERLRFYTNITHELRTPLTLILGPLEDLQKDPGLLPKQHQKISVVRQNALRLLNLINQLLEFRKTETQNKKLCVSKGNISELVTEIGLKYQELNPKPSVDISIDLENENMPLYFDKEVVNTILDNLISNAIKYTDKGRIILSLYTTQKEDVPYTEIKVTDTGYGIPKEEQEHIFERYYQIKNGKQASGTGIGLALVKNLALLHEGEIRVESELDKGSSFYFSLLTHNYYPSALHSEGNDTKEIEQQETLPDITANGRPILLVVEDNTDIRDYISDSFSDGFDVITAAEGDEGCKAAFAHIPDIIVSDIMMPGMDGITFCKIVKEDIRTSHIPVILLTAKTSIDDKEEGYLSGADSYLTKPFSATLLRSRINNLLDIRKKLADQIKFNLKLNSKSDMLKDSINQIDNEFIRSLTQLIENNLEDEKIDIGYLSDKLFMSSSTLYRKIKGLTGISTNEFIRKIRMKHAEELLLTGRYTISEIAFRVGISSPVYFRQCFKEEFGMPPSEYLRRIKTE